MFKIKNNSHFIGIVICFSLLFYFVNLNFPTNGMAANNEGEAIQAYIAIEDDYTLTGEWLFFHEQLLSPRDLNETIMETVGKPVHLPQSFYDLTEEKNTYGTFVTIIKIPENLVGKQLAIHNPYQYSAYKLFIDDEVLIENGEVGFNALTHKTEMAPRTGYFTPETEMVQITLQTSSFEHIRGGVENEIYINEAVQIDKVINRGIFKDTFINGAIFVIGVFMVLFYIYNRKETLFVIFGLFTIFISLRYLFAVPFYYTMILPELSWVWGTRWEYIFTELASMLFVLLMWKWHERLFPKILMYGLMILHIVLIIISFITEPVIFQQLFFNVFYIGIPLFIYFIYLVFRSLKENNVYAKINLISLIIIFIAFLNDYANGQGWIKTPDIMLFAVAIYVTIHVVFMSRHFAQSVQQIEIQNVKLTKLHQSNQTLMSELQREIERKDEFLANTSHELRNPLHGIINISHSILLNKKHLLDEKMKEDIQLQLTIGHHMSHTLNDLLDITRLKEHRITLKKEKLQIESLVFGVIDMLKVLVENENLEIDVYISKDLPNILGDKDRFIQILFNLLHNAIKYTYQGTITVSAYVEEDEVKIAIKDTGIGIDPVQLDKIFKPYEQASSEEHPVMGGLGLGLSIVKELVELHDGTIQVESVVNRGSTFTISLPFVDESLLVEEADLNNEQVYKLSVSDDLKSYPKLLDSFKRDREYVSKPDILIVDDDVVNLRVISNILSKDQYNIETTTKPKEALALIEQREWNLVITDVMMPKMSGYELTKTIREKYSISELPIIILTARSNMDDIYAGFLVGANDYVIKPVDAMELIIRVEALTNLQSSIKERLTMEAAWLQAQIRPHFLLNTLNSILSLSMIDKERMIQLVEHFSHYLRSSFQYKNMDKFVLLKDELDLVHSYLYIEKERFGGRLEVHWDLNYSGEVFVPPLVIQTLVENAVNHGVLPKREGGTVTIQVEELEGDGVKISIIDDGIGMDEAKVKQISTVKPDKKRGIGIMNTKQRLKQILGVQLSIESELGIGTTCSFIIPKRTYYSTDM